MKLIGTDSLSFDINDDLQNINSFKILETIKNLKYVGCGLTNLNDDGLAEICKYGTIENLNLQDTQISNQGIKYLLQLSHLKHLRLKECLHINDACISSINKLNNLKSLGLHETLISREGLKLLNNQSLEDLIIDFDNLTLADLMFISKNNPNCNILIKGKFLIKNGKKIEYI